MQHLPTREPDRLWRALPLHHRDTAIDRADDLAWRMGRLRITERVAERRRLCGRLPDHLERLARWVP
jgi:hypothetical protein